MLRLSYPLRLACRAVIASRALLPITRPSVVCPPPLATAHLPTLTSQRHMITAVPASVDPGEGEGRGWRTQRRRQESRMKTREIVMTEFEGILSQASTGGGLSQKGFEVLKSCASPYLLEPPATKIAMATEMISMLKEKGVSVDVGVFNTLLKIYVSLGHSFTPSQLLTEMQECGAEANLGTLSYLIEAYCQQGNLAGAAKLLEHLRTNQSAITEDIYASLITGHAQNGNMAEANGVFKMMRDKGHPPGNVVYQALRCAYAQHGDREGLNMVREEMRKDRVYASTSSIIRVMDTLSLYNHGHMIPEMLDSIRNKEWMLEDLRALACTLLLRGEIESGLVVVRCLSSYGAVTTIVGCALVRGMALTRQPLGEILDLIGQLPAMSSSGDPINRWSVYRELLGMVYKETLSTGDQRAKDIVTVVTATREHGGREWYVDTAFLLPVLAHYSERGNIEGFMEALQLFLSMKGLYDFYSMRFLDRALTAAHISPSEFLEKFVLKKDLANGPQLINNLLLYLSETGKLRNLTQSLRTLSATEGVKVGLVVRLLLSTLKANYRPGCVHDLAQVYLALSELQPRPALDISVSMTTRYIAVNGARGDRETLYNSLLSPLTQAGVNVGDAHNELLTSFAERDDVTQFMKVYDEVKHLPLSPELHKYAAMNQTQKKRSRQNTFNSQKPVPLPIDLATYDELAASEGGGMVGRANMPQYLHLEKLVLSLLDSDNIKDALRIRDDMLEHGYKLKTIVYNAFIKYYARHGDVQSMLAEVKALENVGQTLTPSVYTSVMTCYSLHGDPEEVRRLMKEASGRFGDVNHNMTSCLILACVNSGQLSEAVQVLSEYTGPLTPRPHALKQLLNELIKQGRPQEEVGVVTEVLRSLPYLTPAGVTDILLWVYLENGRMDEAREVVKSEEFSVKPGVFISHCKQWRAAGKHDILREVVGWFREAGVHKQNAGTALLLLSLYNMLNDVEGASSLAEDLHNNHCEVDARFDRALKRLQSRAEGTQPHQ